MVDQHVTIGMARLAQQYRAIKDEIDEAIARVVSRAVFTPDVEIAALEEEFARFAGVRYAIAVGSGSEAITFALIGLELQPGVEVISVPNVDVSASAPITHAGGRIVWTDIHPRTFNLDPAGLEARITGQTRAVIATHMYGNPADMGPILELAQQRGLAVVEDAALAPGATYRGRPVGSFGKAACFSFSPLKVLGAYGQGGMVTTDDEDVARRVRLYCNHGLDPSCLAAIRRGGGRVRFDYLVEGFNGHLDELQAAVLRVKLRHLPQWLTRRRAHARLYREMLGDLEPSHLLLPEDTPDSQPVYRVFVIRTHRRDELLAHLAAQGIHAGLQYIPPLHFQAAYRGLGLGRGSFPQAELVADELLCLPTIPELTTGEVERVGEAIRQFSLGRPGL